MNQHTDGPRFATITAEGVDYPIYLTSPGRDYIQKNLASKGVPYELSMLTDMKARLTADSTVLDVGANIGNHTFYLAQVVGCRMIAFEANDELAHAMDITTNEANLEERVTVHAFALGEKPGFAEFEQAMPENLGGQSLRKGSGRIKIRTLDSFGISVPITAIKIDVEGMELDVLKGGKKLIESNLPMLYVESQTKESFIEISSYLQTLGYCYRDTFNATPTHLFIHKTKSKNDKQIALSALNRVEHEYDLLAANKKVKKDLIDCQMKYRDICQSNNSLKLENEQLQEQVGKAVFYETGNAQLQVELDLLKQKQVSANQLIEHLKGEIARERGEKEFQSHQYSQKNLAGRQDVALQEKLIAEVERLVAENRSQNALLDGQQALKFALEDSKKKCAEISFILENTKSEVDQAQQEKSRLLAKIREKEGESAQLLRLKEQQEDMEKKQQHLQSELEKKISLVAEYDKRLKEQTLQLQSHAAQLAAIGKQKANLDGLEVQLRQLNSDKAQLSSLLDTSRTEVEKLEPALLECNNQLALLQKENSRLHVEVEDLSQALAVAQKEALKVKELEQRQIEYSSKADQAADDVSRLSFELEACRKDAAKVSDLEHKIMALEEQRVEHGSTIESLKVEYDRYIQGLRALHEQQRRDDDQHLHILIQRKMESLAPLQANQEKLDKLVEYHNDIEKIYAERTPLLSALQENQGIEQIQEKKAALEELNRHLEDFNKSQAS